jgi:hypothetical protein
VAGRNPVLLANIVEVDGFRLRSPTDDQSAGGRLPFLRARTRPPFSRVSISSHQTPVENRHAAVTSREIALFQGFAFAGRELAQRNENGGLLSSQSTRSDPDAKAMAKQAPVAEQAESVPITDVATVWAAPGCGVCASPLALY